MDYLPVRMPRTPVWSVSPESVSRGEQVDNLRLNQCVRAMYLGTGKERRPCQWCSSMPSSLISVVLGFVWVIVVVIVVLCCCCVV